MVNKTELSKLYPGVEFEGVTPYRDNAMHERRLSYPFHGLEKPGESFALRVGPREDLKRLVSKVQTAIWTYRNQPGKHVLVIHVYAVLKNGRDLPANTRITPEIRAQINRVRVQRQPDNLNAPLPGTVRPPRHMSPTPVERGPARVTVAWQPQGRPSPRPAPTAAQPEILAPPARRLALPAPGAGQVAVEAGRRVPPPPASVSSVRTRRPTPRV